MIFYFTGTGNSLFAAKRLLTDGEELINIADCLKEGRYQFTAGDGEAVGLVFPVYFYTVPAVIAEFVEKLTVHNASYVYAVITCGGGICQAGSVLKKLLAPRGLTLNYVTDLLMPDNSMLFYQIPPVSKAQPRLDAAEKRLAEIAGDVAARKSSKTGNSTIISRMVGAGYKLSNKTAKFYANENCAGCGLCQRICPQQVIQLQNGKPEWTKDTCSKCSACINRCPKEAIQYGSATRKRNRYVNPEL